MDPGLLLRAATKLARCINVELLHYYYVELLHYYYVELLHYYYVELLQLSGDSVLCRVVIYCVMLARWS